MLHIKAQQRNHRSILIGAIKNQQQFHTINSFQSIAGNQNKPKHTDICAKGTIIGNGSNNHINENYIQANHKNNTARRLHKCNSLDLSQPKQMPIISNFKELPLIDEQVKHQSKIARQRNMSIGNELVFLPNTDTEKSSLKKPFLISNLNEVKSRSTKVPKSPDAFAMTARINNFPLPSTQSTLFNTPRVNASNSIADNTIEDTLCSTPLCPLAAIKQYKKELTPYEMTEIHKFTEIYYVGQHYVKSAYTEDSKLNHGWDDSNGYYITNNYDHLAYRYQILSTQGKGSFGIVYKAYDHKLKKIVAVKMLKNSPTFSNQGETEVLILEKLKGSGNAMKFIVEMLGHFIFRGHFCIVFELLSLNLYELLQVTKFRV